MNKIFLLLLLLLPRRQLCLGLTVCVLSAMRKNKNKNFLWVLNIILMPQLKSFFKDNHDDVIKWKHFPRYWPFVRGIHRSSVDSPHKGQWRGVLMFHLICAKTNDWANSPYAGDLRCHGAHCDVIMMRNLVYLTWSIPWPSMSWGDLLKYEDTYAEIIWCMRSANERRCCIATSCPIGWAHTRLFNLPLLNSDKNFVWYFGNNVLKPRFYLV